MNIKKISTSLQIHGLELPVLLGWSEIERIDAQIILLDIKIKFLTPPAACQTDELADTICYDGLIEKIKQYLKKRTYRLVEYLAKDIFTLIKTNIASLESLTICITKHPKISGLNGNICFTYQEVFHP